MRIQFTRGNRNLQRIFKKFQLGQFALKKKIQNNWPHDLLNNEE